MRPCNWALNGPRRTDELLPARRDRPPKLWSAVLPSVCTAAEPSARLFSARPAPSPDLCRISSQFAADSRQRCASLRGATGTVGAPVTTARGTTAGTRPRSGTASRTAGDSPTTSGAASAASSSSSSSFSASSSSCVPTTRHTPTPAMQQLPIALMRCRLVALRVRVRTQGGGPGLTLLILAAAMYVPHPTHCLPRPVSCFADCRCLL